MAHQKNLHAATLQRGATLKTTLSRWSMGRRGLIMESMPFTPSHVAAGVPFFRTGLVPSALVIGCMAPDIEYFMRLKAEGGFGHTIPGLFIFDLPVSLVVLWMFHTYAKEPIYSWLPVGVRRRIRLGPLKMPIRNAAQFLLVAVSILVGSITHLLWDSLTHRTMWPYRHWAFLSRTVRVPLYGNLEFLRVIQHVSTIGGALVLLLWFRAWYRDTPPTQPERVSGMPPSRHAVLVFMVAVALIAALVHGILGVGRLDNRGSDKTFLAYFVVTSITVCWLEIVAYGAFRMHKRNQRLALNH